MCNSDINEQINRLRKPIIHFAPLSNEKIHDKPAFIPEDKVLCSDSHVQWLNDYNSLFDWNAMEESRLRDEESGKRMLERRRRFKRRFGKSFKYY